MTVTMGTNEKLQEILPGKDGMKAEKHLSMAAVQLDSCQTSKKLLFSMGTLRQVALNPVGHNPLELTDPFTGGSLSDSLLFRCLHHDS